MTALDSRLRSHLDVSAQQIVAPALDVDAAIARAGRRRRNRRVTLATAALLVVVGVGLVANQLVDDDPQGLRTIDQEEFLWDPAEVGGPDLSQLDSGWYRIDIEPTAADDAAAIAAGPNGLVELGWDDPIIIRHSIDGRSWTVTKNDIADRVFSDLPEIVANKAGYVVNTSTAALFSPDGIEWIDLDPQMQNGAVAATADEFIVASEVAGALVIWRSADGHNWEAVESNPEGFTRERNLRMATYGSTIVVAAGELNRPSENVWASSDDVTWMKSDFAIPWLLNLAAGPTGFVALESDYALWFSPDGVTWDEVVSGERLQEMANQDVVVAEDGRHLSLIWNIGGSPSSFIAIGERVGPKSAKFALTSTDGRTWSTIIEPRRDDEFALSVAAVEGGFVVRGAPSSAWYLRP